MSGLQLDYSAARCLNVHLDVCRPQMWQVERSRGPWHGPPQPCKLGGSVLSTCVRMPRRECCTGGLPAAKPVLPLSCILLRSGTVTQIWA